MLRMEACLVVARMNFASMKRAKEREEKRCREFLERKREAKESEKEERGIRSVHSTTPLTSGAESIDLSHLVFAPVFFLLHPVQWLSAFQTSKSKLSCKRKRRKTAKSRSKTWHRFGPKPPRPRRIPPRSRSSSRPRRPPASCSFWASTLRPRRCGAPTCAAALRPSGRPARMPRPSCSRSTSGGGRPGGARQRRTLSGRRRCP